MFILADKFKFDPDPKMCFLAASLGYSSRDSLSWNLKLHSLEAYTSLIPPKERGPGYDKLAFGVDCRNLIFEVGNWTELARSTFDLPQDSLSCAFSVLQWEDLKSLSLGFGRMRPGEIEVTADGVGCVESLADWFPDCEVGFSIHTWARFLGVSIDVPVNANNPIAYAHKQIKNLLPGFIHGETTIRRVADESGILKGVEVFYAPK